jgi:hypothetical protein
MTIDMATQRYPLDRSAAFTALLELDRDGFGKQDMEASGKAIDEFLESWYASDSKDMYKHAQTWLAERQEAAGHAPERQRDLRQLHDPRPAEWLWDIPEAQERGQ